MHLTPTPRAAAHQPFPSSLPNAPKLHWFDHDADHDLLRAFPDERALELDAAFKTEYQPEWPFAWLCPATPRARVEGRRAGFQDALAAARHVATAGGANNVTAILQGADGRLYLDPQMWAMPEGDGDVEQVEIGAGTLDSVVRPAGSQVLAVVDRDGWFDLRA